MCFFAPLSLFQKRPGDPNPQYFSESTAVQMGGVLPYKQEAYCSTNGRCTVGFPFLGSLEARKVRRYKRGAYCRTNWRCTAVLFRQVAGVGVSETLPTVDGVLNRNVKNCKGLDSANLPDRLLPSGPCETSRCLGSESGKLGMRTGNG